MSFRIIGILYGWAPMYLGGFFLYQFVLEKHTHGGRIGIIILPLPYGNDKYREKDDRNTEADGQQHINNTHTLPEFGRKTKWMRIFKK